MKNYTPARVEEYPLELKSKIKIAIEELGNDFEALQDMIDPIEAVYPGIHERVLSEWHNPITLWKQNQKN